MVQYEKKDPVEHMRYFEDFRMLGAACRARLKQPRDHPFFGGAYREA